MDLSVAKPAVLTDWGAGRACTVQVCKPSPTAFQTHPEACTVQACRGWTPVETPGYLAR